ncbi:MAG: hypothetical protein KBD06_01690 [Candidatus Pacebacteria bacterium]|nr:hypothetical protein [Candidatus Paceibacterota bacterium]
MAIEQLPLVPFRNGKIQGNNFRFMPGRTTSSQTVFRSLSYVRGTTNLDGNEVMSLGAVIGPNQEVKGSGDSVIIDPNAKIIPVHATTKDDVVPIREFLTPEELKKPANKRRPKKFIDFATFKEMAPNDVQLVRYLGEPKINVEAWTGLFEPMTEEMYQLLPALNHGSTAYSGGRNVVKARKGLIDPNAPEAEKVIARKLAKMLYEDHGDLCNGIPMWSVRTWEIEYSSKDSELVLARHFNAFYTIEVDKGEALKITKFTDKDATKWERRFQKDFNAQLIADQVRADIDAGIQSQTAA